MAEKRADIMDHSLASHICADRYPDWLWHRLDWFQDLKFGLFMHWGPYSRFGCDASWSLCNDADWARYDTLKPWIQRDKDFDRYCKDYWNEYKHFNPVNFEPEKWAELAVRAGMKYVNFTTKHHDGFCMWDTKTTDYRITSPDCPFHSNPRSNIAKEVFDAFRARNMAVSCYFSKPDWHSPYYWIPDRPRPDRNVNYDINTEPEIWEKFIEFTYAQIEELMRDFGPIDVLWLDGGQVRPPLQHIRMEEMAKLARTYQPDLIMADRTAGGFCENILTPEQEVPDAPLGHAWESCITITKRSWGFIEGGEYRSEQNLIQMLADVVCKDGNLLLNVGPRPDGTFDQGAVDRLEAIGRWMDVNSQAIHNTRALAPYKSGNIGFTRKGDTAYAILFAEEDATTPPAQVSWTGPRPEAGAPIKMLGMDKPLAWSMDGDAVKVDCPQQDLPCEHAWVLSFPLAQ